MANSTGVSLFRQPAAPVSALPGSYAPVRDDDDDDDEEDDDDEDDEDGEESYSISSTSSSPRNKNENRQTKREKSRKGKMDVGASGKKPFLTLVVARFVTMDGCAIT